MTKATTEKTGLTSRHVQLIAIGGTIGTGLFMGAGKSISYAGPAIVLIYVIIGLFMFVTMRAMGEMLYMDPKQPTFINFIAKYVGHRTGVFARWSYWLAVVFLGMTELTATADYVHLWLPGVASWIIQLIILAALTAVNLVAVALFGETEFWFAMIKIVAIIALIVTGIIMLTTGFQTPHGHVQVANLTHHLELFPKGVFNFVNAFQMVMFAFVGMEFIGMTSAETADPRAVIPKAINQIPIRILLFYLGSLLTIMVIYPWQALPADQSPFVMVFKLAGVNWAAALVNFIVLTSAASALNSAIFSASRNFYAMAKDSRQRMFAPLRKMSANHVPTPAILVTAAVIGLSAVISLVPQITSAFSFVSSAATDMFLLIYLLILVAFWRYRQTPEATISTFRLPCANVLVPLTTIFFVFVFGSLFFNADSQLPAIGATLWLVAFATGNFFSKKLTKAA